MKTHELTVSSLICKLKEFGLSDPRGTKKELQDLCKSLNISISVTEPDILEGWVGKPKGALQLLFELGWIDPDNIKMYTANGKSADSSSSGGNEYSIQNLMKLQEDFTDEITLLQYHAQQLGVRVDRTPKCHPEVAGEGIEYAWGIAKLFYRRSDIREKRNKNSFMTLVRKATDSTGELDINRIRSCSRKARSYMKLYTIIQSLKYEELSSDKHAILEEAIKKYRQLKKRGKGHRSVLDRNRDDITQITSECPINTIHKKDSKDELVKMIVNKMNCM